MARATEPARASIVGASWIYWQGWHLPCPNRPIRQRPAEDAKDQPCASRWLRLPSEPQAGNARRFGLFFNSLRTRDMDRTSARTIPSNIRSRKTPGLIQPGLGGIPGSAGKLRYSVCRLPDGRSWWNGDPEAGASCISFTPALVNALVLACRGFNSTFKLLAPTAPTSPCSIQLRQACLPRHRMCLPTARIFRPASAQTM